MIRILIVDDNPVIVDGVRALVRWEDNGFYAGFGAYDGRQALQIVRQEPIDIVITDLKMPGMDGIELIQRLTEEMFDVKIVVLSAYEEFAMVHDAFKNGASEYLLKTQLDPQQMLQICRDLADLQIREREQRRSRRLKLSVFDEQNVAAPTASSTADRQAIRCELIRAIVGAPKGQSEAIATNLLTRGLVAAGSSYAVALLLAETTRESDSAGTTGRYHHKRTGDEWRLNQALTDHGIGSGAVLFDGRLAAILAREPTVDAPDFLRRLDEVFRSLSRWYQDHMGQVLSAGISSFSGSLADAPRLFSEAEEALDHRRVTGKGRLITVGQSRVDRGWRRIDTTLRVDRLAELLDSLPHTDINSLIRELGISDADARHSDINTLRQLFENYIPHLMHYAQRFQLGRECGWFVKRFYNYLYEHGSIREMNEWFRDFIMVYVRHLTSGSSVVRQAQQYVHDHLAETISLASVSANLGVSAGHLSRLFTDELGHSFTRYLNAVRVERAKELLATGLHRVYEVAYAVGYNNVEHFIRVFKKSTGKTPRQMFPVRVRPTNDEARQHVDE